MKRLRLFLVLVLSISLIATPSFAAPKAGAKCTKAGATSTTGGIKYTCVKSGTKLVWNNGVAIKKNESSSKIGNKVEAKNLLASDSRITPTSSLTSLEMCKTEDKTPQYLEGGVLRHRNGFPRPSDAITGKKKAKILVIPMSFKDAPFFEEKVARGPFGQLVSSDLELVNETIPRVKDGFREISSGRFELTVDVLPKKEWWIFDIDNPLSSVWGSDNIGKISELIRKYKADFVFDGYDSFVFVFGNGLVGSQGLGTAQGDIGIKVANSKTGKFNGMFLAGNLQNTTLWIHELGHSFFGLEDLYRFSEVNSRDVPKLAEMDVPMKWDLMASSGRGLALLEWNRLLMGWLEEVEVRCLTDQKSTVHYLSDSATTKDPKLLTINLSPGVTLAAETRDGTGNNGKGLLLYLINTYQDAGDGSVLTQNAVITKSQSKSLLGWQFTVLDNNDDGVLIEVIKTDIDKFVPPAATPRPTQSGPENSKIKISDGEVISLGYLKARAIWNVTGYESFRLYITDAVDFQRVFFETGIRNSSQSPLAIEIMGTSCNRQVRVVTMFFSEKDGKGERVVRENKDLAILACEDSTKKP